MYIFWKTLKQTVKEFISDDPMLHSSSIAFYTIFSLPAILMIAISIAGSAYETQLVENNLNLQINRLFGVESAKMVAKIMASSVGFGSSLFAKLIGVATLAFSATTVFVSLQNGLNSIWGVEAKSNQGIWSFIVNRFLSLALVVSIGFLLLVSLVIDTMIAVFNEILNTWFSEATSYIILGLNIAISLAIVTLVFAFIFKVLPDAKIEWRDVWVGALVTMVLFTVGKYLIGFYLASSSLGSAYGTAGSLVLLLIWVYYSTTILLFGAQFTVIYSRNHGHFIHPEDHAVGVHKVSKESAILNEPPSLDV